MARSPRPREARTIALELSRSETDAAVSSAAADMSATLAKCRMMITASRALMSKVDALLERDKRMWAPRPR
jgi:hypothetical protein